MGYNIPLTERLHLINTPWQLLACETLRTDVLEFILANLTDLIQ